MTEKNHEYYVSLEVAQLLKKAGFNWEINTCRYNSSPDKVSSNGMLISNFNGYAFQHITISAPTLEVAQRWLRKVKNCYVSVVADCDSVGVFYITRIIYYDADTNYHVTYIWEKTELERVKHRMIFNNYEEALEAGIKKALEIILEEGK